MADRYLLESGSPDGFLLEDGSGVLLLENSAAPTIVRPTVVRAPDPILAREFVGYGVTFGAVAALLVATQPSPIGAAEIQSGTHARAYADAQNRVEHYGTPPSLMPVVAGDSIFRQHRTSAPEQINSGDAWRSTVPAQIRSIVAKTAGHNVSSPEQLDNSGVSFPRPYPAQPPVIVDTIYRQHFTVAPQQTDDSRASYSRIGTHYLAVITETAGHIVSAEVFPAEGYVQHRGTDPQLIPGLGTDVVYRSHVQWTPQNWDQAEYALHKLNTPELIPPAVTPPFVEPEQGGGWWPYWWERERALRERKRRLREQLERETEEIQEALDREIARTERELEAKDDRAAELARLKAAAEKAGKELAETEYNERVAAALERAVTQGNYSALEALEREMRRAEEEAEFFAVAITLILADD